MTLPVVNGWAGLQLRRHPRAHFALRRAKHWVLATAERLGFSQTTRPMNRPEIQQVRRIAAHPKSRQLLRARADGPRVLVFSPRGAWPTHLAWETIVALALKLRGARCEFLTCGAAMPTCTAEGHRPARCGSCYPYVQDFVLPFGFSIHTLARWAESGTDGNGRDGLDALDLDGLVDYTCGGLELGKIVLPTVRWALRRRTLIADRRTLDTYRAFLCSAMVVSDALLRFLDRFPCDVIFCLNGYFESERILRVLAAQRGIRVVSYERGFRPDTLFLAHEVPACQYNVDGLWPAHASSPLTEKEETILDTYLAERYKGTRGIGGLVFWPTVEEDQRLIREQLRLDSRPLAALFTNVLFDTAVQDRDLAFRSIFEWLDFTVRQFATHPEWQLVIRVHPSEVRDIGRESMEPVVDWIIRTFTLLPENIKIVRPESNLSSYTLMRMSRVGLVYTTTAGMEMALMGKRVITSGLHYYRGKGFTEDVDSPETYAELLVRRMGEESGLSPSEMDLARRYAYFFFFRAMIPFKLVTEPRRGQVQLNFQSLSELLPGRDQGLDVILDGILNGRSFFL